MFLNMLTYFILTTKHTEGISLRYDEIAFPTEPLIR